MRQFSKQEKKTNPRVKLLTMIETLNGSELNRRAYWLLYYLISFLSRDAIESLIKEANRVKSLES